MTKQHPVLTKTCSHCGLKKPLSAFLQISGPQGTTYGNICASCRKASQETTEERRESEETTQGETGVHIDNEAKMTGDADKKNIRQRLDELYREEREEEKELLIDKTQRADIKVRDEKKHLSSFLEKRSFLERPQKPYTSAQEQVVGGEQQAAKERTIESTDTQIAGKTKHSSSIFNAFKAREAAAPIASNPGTAGKTIAAGTNKDQALSQKDKEKSLTDLVEHSFGINSRPRRR